MVEGRVGSRAEAGSGRFVVAHKRAKSASTISEALLLFQQELKACKLRAERRRPPIIDITPPSHATGRTGLHCPGRQVIIAGSCPASYPHATSQPSYAVGTAIPTKAGRSRLIDGLISTAPRAPSQPLMYATDVM
jgi:hypothetical protein